MPPPPWFDDGQVRDMWRALRAFVRRRVRPRAQADDIVQETWLRALSSSRDERELTPAWFCVVARRLIVDDARLEKRRVKRERAVARDTRPASVDSEWEQRIEAAARALEELQEPYREVVLLRYRDGFDAKEIALRLGRPEATVRSQLKRGLDHLRVRLGVRTDDDGRRRITWWLPWRWRSDASREARGGARKLVWAGAMCAVMLVSVWRFLESRSIDPRSLRDSVVDVAPSHATAAAIESDGPPAVGDQTERVRTATVVTTEATEARAASPVAHVVRGRVLNRLDARGIGGARVLAASEDLARVSALGVSDAFGEFEVSVLDLPAWIWAEHDVYAPTTRILVDPEFVASGEALALESIGAGRVTGRIVDPDGRSVPGARVAFNVIAHPRAVRNAQGALELAGPPVVANTDGSGSFATLKPTSGRVRVTVEAAGFATRSEVVTLGPLQQTDVVELALSRDDPARRVAPSRADEIAPAAPLAARTVWADGTGSGPRHQPMFGEVVAPAEGGASVRGVLSCAYAARGPGIDLRLDGDTSHESRRVRRSADGGFRFAALRPDRYSLHVEGGGAHGASELARFELATDEARDLGALVAPYPGSVSVHTFPVATPEDAPALVTLLGEGADLRVNWRTGGLGVEFDRARGVIAVRSMWPGEYELFVSGPRIADAMAACIVSEGSETHVEFELERGLHTFVAVNPVRPLRDGERWRVFLHSSAGVSELTDMDLRFNVHPDGVLNFYMGIAPGVDRVEIRTSAGLAGERSLVGLSARERAHIEVSLR